MRQSKQAMRAERGKIQSDLNLTDALDLLGMCTGRITVHPGGVLKLHGMCTGGLEVLKGGTAIINGVCPCDVVNSGGTIELFGSIHGNLEDKAGKTIVHPGAVLRPRA